MTAIDYPPMQDPASFDLDAVHKQIDDMIKTRHGQSVPIQANAFRARRPLGIMESAAFNRVEN